MESESMARLIAKFRTLPGVGLKTATRYAYSVIEKDVTYAEEFAEAIVDAKRKIHFCKECGNYTDAEICDICATRDKSVICVVAEPKDIAPFEKMGDFNGVYHVLHGVIDFQKGVGVDDIRIKELLARLTGVKEVIVATNPDIGGELTATYLANLIKPLGITVSRLAYGISVGSEIEYADELTLQRALKDRKKL
ncbi:MAG: recombination mediator RecR [Clostridiales bacterium]|jgi:recombination protein RecR|nr:recombination mediator RecR [Clostridiales bacterium]MDY4656030.1 recombination mediator RecR [Eubacteriales bacterium]